VASTPREAPDAASVLVGQRLTRDVIAQAAERAAGPSKPLDNTDFTHPYRKRVTRVFVERALLAIAGLGEGPRGQGIA
jgi:CO/xanthine dehydrogenase FAD-binding subunit